MELLKSVHLGVPHVRSVAGVVLEKVKMTVRCLVCERSNQESFRESIEIDPQVNICDIQFMVNDGLQKKAS